jgi:adenylosuccinate lyase
MGYTHMQPAEPTTLGYRLAGYTQDLLADWFSLQELSRSLSGKGL